MRHRKKKVTLDRKKGPRQALLRTQAISLINNKKIKTTTAKAKALRVYSEKIITKAKKNDLASKREIYKLLHNKAATDKLIKNIAPKLKDRKGGYLRLTKLGYRKGDGAPITQIEIIL